MKSASPDYEIRTFEWLVRTTFRNIHELKSRHVWIIGAGASVDSKIPSASQLAQEWACDLAGLDKNTATIEELNNAWKLSNTLTSIINNKTKDIAPEFLAEKYFEIYGARFGKDPRAGYDDLRNRIANKIPSIGYLVLAQLINAKSNLVITVNFDNLVTDALFLAGNHLPLVLDHENVAHLTNPENGVPIVCKIHRDLLKNPMNSVNEVKSLSNKWVEPLDQIFKHYSPIFIGYGGHDHTLMGYLANPSMTFCANPIWLHYTKTAFEDENTIRRELNSTVTNFLRDSNGILVPFSGFDSLMFYARKELKLPDVVEHFDTRVSKIRNLLQTQKAELSGDQGKSAATDPISKASLEIISSQSDKSVDDWVALAESQPSALEKILMYDTAIEQFEHFGLYVNRGNAKSTLQMYSQSIDDYDRAIHLNINYSSAYLNRALSYLALDNYEAAISDFDIFISLDPTNSNAFVSRGNCKALIGLHEQAIADYDLALKFDAKNFFAYLQKGGVYILRKMYTDAIKSLNSALAIQDDSSEAYLQRAIAKLSSNLTVESIKDFDESIKLYSDNPSAYFNRGVAFFRLGFYERALDDLNRSVSLDKDNHLLYRAMGLIYIEQGMYEQAIVSFDQCIELNPSFASVFDHRGLCNLRLGYDDKALIDFQTALTLDPYLDTANYNAACVLAKFNRVREALVHLDIAIRLNVEFRNKSIVEPCFKAILDNPEFVALTSDLI